jgi:hypothetical protein
VRVRNSLIRLGLVAVLLSAACDASPTGAGRDTDPDDQAQPRYVFSDVEVTMRQDDGRSVAVVGARTTWADGRFPGVYRCAWRVFDHAGAEIGKRIDTLVAMSPENPVTRVPIFLEGNDEAARAAIACADERLDVGGAYAYAFSEVHPVPPDPTGEPWGIAFDAAWQGSGMAGPVTCTAELRSSDAVLASVEVNILVGKGRVHDSRVYFHEPHVKFRAADVAGGALRDCRPFGD